MVTALLALLLHANIAQARQSTRVVGPMGREYFVFTPDKIDAQKTYWLVVGAHGNNQSGKNAAWIGDWVDRGDCIAVAPSFPQGFQGLGDNSDNQLLQIFSALQHQYKLHSKLFVTGHSAGAQFAHRFASKHADKTLGCAASSAGSWATGGEFGNFSSSARTIPIAISCGEQDTKPAGPGAQYGRLEWAKRFEKQLADGHFFYKAKYWPGAGHGGNAGGDHQLQLEAFSLGTSGLIGEAATERDDALAKIDALVEAEDYSNAVAALRAILAKMKTRTPAQFAADLNANDWHASPAAVAECVQRSQQFWNDQASELTARINARSKPPTRP